MDWSFQLDKGDSNIWAQGAIFNQARAMPHAPPLKHLCSSTQMVGLKHRQWYPCMWSALVIGCYFLLSVVILAVICCYPGCYHLLFPLLFIVITHYSGCYLLLIYLLFTIIPCYPLLFLLLFIVTPCYSHCYYNFLLLLAINTTYFTEAAHQYSRRQQNAATCPTDYKLPLRNYIGDRDQKQRPFH